MHYSEVHVNTMQIVCCLYPIRLLLTTCELDRPNCKFRILDVTPILIESSEDELSIQVAPHSSNPLWVNEYHL